MNSESENEERTWTAILHASQLANFLLPFAGIIAVIVIWQTKKDRIAGIDAHAKVVINWMISSFIYAIGFFILSFILIGIPLLFVLGLLGIGFPIYGAIKANEGVLWRYPLSIRFFT